MFSSCTVAQDICRSSVHKCKPLDSIESPSALDWFPPVLFTWRFPIFTLATQGLTLLLFSLPLSATDRGLSLALAKRQLLSKFGHFMHIVMVVALVSSTVLGY